MGKMTHLVKVLATKPCDLRSVPRPLLVKERPAPPKAQNLPVLPKPASDMEIPGKYL